MTTTDKPVQRGKPKDGRSIATFGQGWRARRITREAYKGARSKPSKIVAEFVQGDIVRTWDFGMRTAYDTPLIEVHLLGIRLKAKAALTHATPKGGLTNRGRRRVRLHAAA